MYYEQSRLSAVVCSPDLSKQGAARVDRFIRRAPAQFQDGRTAQYAVQRDWQAVAGRRRKTSKQLVLTDTTSTEMIVGPL